MIFGGNIQKTRIEFACFNFHLGLLFIDFIDFLSFKLDTENDANFDAVCQANAPTFTTFSKVDKMLIKNLYLRM